MSVVAKYDASKILADVTGDRRFFSQDGCACKNLAELSECLGHMSPEVFSHHVNDTKNDLSNWIRDVLGDVTLANELSAVTTLNEAARMTSQRVAWLRRKVRWTQPTS